MSSSSVSQEGQFTPPDGKTINSIPLNIKLGLAFFVFIVLCIGIYVVVNMGRDASQYTIENAVDTSLAEVNALNNVVPDILNVPNQADKQDQTDLSVAQNNNNTASVDQSHVVASSNFFEKRINRTEEKLNDAIMLIQRAVSDSKATNQDVKRLSGEFSGLTTALNELVSTVDDLAVRIATQDEQIQHLTRRLHSSREVAKPARPAFNLLSIDRWGDRDSVVLELDGQVATASVGDIRAGWSLKAIRSGCVEVERIKDHKMASVCVSKGDI
jgi:Na+-transporting methylmalonyl-CoA/oxaloacetate decarboxylase gamma subunit